MTVLRSAPKAIYDAAAMTIYFDDITDLDLELLDEFKRQQPAWNHSLLIGDCGGAVVSESEDA